MSRRALVVAVALVVALGLRVAFVESTSYRAVNDAGTYNRFAAAIATDGDYTTGSNGPGTGAGGSRGPTAYFPPGYSYALALADLLDGHSSGHQAALPGERLENAALGTVTVGLVGLVALEMCGAGPALAALVLAAVDPVLVELSGVLVAENLLVVLELMAVWAGLRARGSPRPWRWIGATGVLTGLATLTHENAVVMALPLAVAAVVAVRGRAAGGSLGRTAGAVALLLACTAVTIAPWTVRNALQLHRFVPVADEAGITVRGTYNPVSAADRSIPYKWRLFWFVPQDQAIRRRAGTMSEDTLSSLLEHRALHYIDRHPSAPLTAGADNLARMFELEGAAAWQASARAVDLSVDDARIGVIAFWVLCLLALAGLATRAARAAPRWPWAVPVLFALSVILVNVETPRFREPIDPFLLVLAGCAVDAVLRRGSAPARP
ncbi:MAG TPA: glycosyltransferase family 39 protein [Solirubrobacteraceae bacterium]